MNNLERLSSIDKPSQPSPVSPWDNSLDRSSGSIHSAEQLAHSPPRAPPEIWKPTISPAEDARPAKHYNRGRRGSSTSKRSTGSGASIRPSITENVLEWDDDVRRRPPRTRLSSIDKPSQPSPVSPWDNSLDRSSGLIHSAEQLAHSPPRAPPEIWKPTISPAEDTRPAKQYDSDRGRRGSSTNMRSTGSGGASIQPSIAETIPERADDDKSDESAIEENDYDRAQETTEQGRTTRISMDKSCEKEELPHLRTSGQSLVDTNLRSDDRPIPARSSYGDERDYDLQYSTPQRPHGLKSSPYHPQWESRPISLQVSFTRQPHVDLDDNDNWRETDREEGRDRERYWDREYDRDRDRRGGERDQERLGNWGWDDRDRERDRDRRRDILLLDPQRLMAYPYPYSASRHASYPNLLPGDSLNYWSPPDNLERPDSTRSGPGLSRQSSNVRPRDDPDRRFTGDNGS